MFSDKTCPTLKLFLFYLQMVLTILRFATDGATFVVLSPCAVLPVLAYKLIFSLWGGRRWILGG